LQPFCLDCGTVDDLTVDHLPQAWERREQGLAVRLEDVEVVCRVCNSRRGAARGRAVRADDGRSGTSGIAESATLTAERT
jgi:5-methylcytosine-specific restriction endonuclease McrA